MSSRPRSVPVLGASAPVYIGPKRHVTFTCDHCQRSYETEYDCRTHEASCVHSPEKVAVDHELLRKLAEEATEHINEFEWGVSRELEIGGMKLTFTYGNALDQQKWEDAVEDARETWESRQEDGEFDSDFEIPSDDELAQWLCDTDADEVCTNEWTIDVTGPWNPRWSTLHVYVRKPTGALDHLASFTDKDRVHSEPMYEEWMALPLVIEASRASKRPKRV